jgi:hypothetical protein
MNVPIPQSEIREAVSPIFPEVLAEIANPPYSYVGGGCSPAFNLFAKSSIPISDSEWDTLRGSLLTNLSDAFEQGRPSHFCNRIDDLVSVFFERRDLPADLVNAGIQLCLGSSRHEKLKEENLFRNLEKSSSMEARPCETRSREVFSDSRLLSCLPYVTRSSDSGIAQRAIQAFLDDSSNSSSTKSSEWKQVLEGSRRLCKHDDPARKCESYGNILAYIKEKFKVHHPIPSMIELEEKLK